MNQTTLAYEGIYCTIAILAGVLNNEFSHLLVVIPRCNHNFFFLNVTLRSSE
jgi:hypothetical protein